MPCGLVSPPPPVAQVPRSHSRGTPSGITVATVAGGELEVVSSSSPPHPRCTLPGQHRLVIPLEGWLEVVEDITQQPDQDPVEVRTSVINSRPSHPLTAHPGPASGLVEALPGVAGAGGEVVEEFTT